MLKASVPVIAVSAVRTGCGKSQVARYLSKRLRAAGLKVAVVRHPMPYGDLVASRIQRFETLRDLDLEYPRMTDEHLKQFAEARVRLAEE